MIRRRPSSTLFPTRRSSDLMFLIGVPSVRPVIGQIAPDSIAAQAGIHTPAEIIAVNQTATPDWQQVNLNFAAALGDRKSTRLNSSHVRISYAVSCLKKKITQ